MPQPDANNTIYTKRQVHIFGRKSNDIIVLIKHKRMLALKSGVAHETIYHFEAGTYPWLNIKNFSTNKKSDSLTIRFAFSRVNYGTCSKCF